MWGKKPIAYLRQKRVYFNDDEIQNEENMFLPGLIKFEYDLLKATNYNKSGRLDKTESELTLSTHDPIYFHEGDMIKVNSKWYTILRVNESLDPKYNSFVALNPHSIERFKIKELELK